jgi:hypothetical protein
MGTEQRVGVMKDVDSCPSLPTVLGFAYKVFFKIPLHAEENRGLRTQIPLFFC